MTQSDLSAEGLSHLLTQADAALYAAKHRGRDQVVIDPGPAP